jgi:hypothetical protein
LGEYLNINQFQRDEPASSIRLRQRGAQVGRLVPQRSQDP